MELRGHTLVKGVPDNPKWISFPDGVPKAYYAIDWEGTRRAIGPDGGLMPNVREESLEDSQGMVEYRIIGIFWSKERAYDAITTLSKIRADEKAAKNPTRFAYGTKGGGE